MHKYYEVKLPIFQLRPNELLSGASGVIPRARVLSMDEGANCRQLRLPEFKSQIGVTILKNQTEAPEKLAF